MKKDDNFDDIAKWPEVEAVGRYKCFKKRSKNWVSNYCETCIYCYDLSFEDILRLKNKVDAECRARGFAEIYPKIKKYDDWCGEHAKREE